MKFRNAMPLVAWTSLLSAVAIAPSSTAKSPDGTMSFNEDIRPILSEHCIACHGPDPDSREAGLRLDTRAGATEDLGGYAGIIPGDPDASEILARITTDDLDDRMPPADHAEALDAHDIEALRAWISEGAHYETHWSFITLQRPELPEVRHTDWPANPLDFFTLAEMEERVLSPSEEAAPEVWLRRAALDLTGLPPEPETVQAFTANPTPEAYERAVDDLLGSPAYGERWARLWLDLARYADSMGYGSDPLRVIWKYRDWVIGALNDNLPFDQFTRQQLAGDLLPNPSEDQLLATAFHRNTMTNTEGGTDDEEFRVEAVRDRVDTTMQVWMGLTAGCAKCHTHKYDPISQTEYYQLYDFFNQSADADRSNEEPRLATPTPKQVADRAAAQAEVDAHRQMLNTLTEDLQSAFETWLAETGALSAADVAEASSWSYIGPFTTDGFDDAYGQNFVNAGEVDLEKTYKDDTLAWEVIEGEPEFFPFEGDDTAHYVTRTLTVEKPTNLYVELGSDDSIQVWLNGSSVLGRKVNREAKPAQETLRLELKEGENRLLIKVANYRDDSGLYFRFKEVNADKSVVDLLAKAADERSEEDNRKLKEHYLSVTPLRREARGELGRLEGRVRQIDGRILRTPIMQELPEDQKRTSRLMVKGSFLNLGDEVQAATPEFLHGFPEDVERNRLGLANWLMSPENPLTARVAVNRLWAQLFGKGIVMTEEDFGAQGALPTHPELLDWLAIRYQYDLAWDTKAFLKEIVLSATYRQTSKVSSEKVAADPDNTWLSRAPRFRLEAEMVRDYALAVSGALSREIGGPSVYPPQPDGIWQAAFNGQRNWATSDGSDRFRRGIYTYLRRSAPYPSMLTFDAPSREVCSIRRTTTNTPLQAFVTLNDEAFVEMAQALALRLLTEGGESTESKIRRGLWLALAREPDEAQVNVLVDLYQEQLAVYKADTEGAESLLGTIFKEDIEALATHPEAAAWVVVANVLLNLDGALTRG